MKLQIAQSVEQYLDQANKAIATYYKTKEAIARKEHEEKEQRIQKQWEIFKRIVGEMIEDQGLFELLDHETIQVKFDEDKSRRLFSVSIKNMDLKIILDTPGVTITPIDLPYEQPLKNNIKLNFDDCRLKIKQKNGWCIEVDEDEKIFYLIGEDLLLSQRDEEIRSMIERKKEEIWDGNWSYEINLFRYYLISNPTEPLIWTIEEPKQINNKQDILMIGLEGNEYIFDCLTWNDNCFLETTKLRSIDDCHKYGLLENVLIQIDDVEYDQEIDRLLSVPGKIHVVDFQVPIKAIRNVFAEKNQG